MSSESKRSPLLSRGVRRALLSSVALVPAVLFAPSVFAQANAGRDRSYADTDGRDGETVFLDGSGSSTNYTSYTWSINQGQVIGTGRTTSVRLPDGNYFVQLTATAGQVTSTDFVNIVVGNGTYLSEIDSLTRNRKSLAGALEDLCVGAFDLGTPGNEGGVTLTAAEEDFQNRCFAVLGGEGTVESVSNIIEQLGAEEFSSFRTLSVVFAETQFQTVMDRLLALRAGARGGVSLAGLNLRNGDRTVDAGQLMSSLTPFFSGGASSDGPEPGGLLDNRLGLWMRGNYGEGEKGVTEANAGFDSDQWGITAGADYRFGASAVAGIAVGYGKADLDFNPIGRGGIETKSVSVSAYGTAYLGNVYVDGVVSYLDADYHSSRHVAYEEEDGFGDLVDQTFLGNTGGKTLSAAVQAGYDFNFGAFTLAPSVGYNYVDVKIDAFTEGNGQVLNPGFAFNLAFADQDYKSSTGSIGLRASYAINLPWGVLVPHFRGFLVREFEDELAAFNVRFASDPFQGTASESPPIVIQSDAIDDSYLRLAVGASAQFKGDISGYFEYQRLEGYEAVDFHDFTVGLRFQHSF